jgi:hypothetical protein
MARHLRSVACQQLVQSSGKYMPISLCFIASHQENSSTAYTYIVMTAGICTFGRLDKRVEGSLWEKFVVTWHRAVFLE